jgi:hypothetical protein
MEETGALRPGRQLARLALGGGLLLALWLGSLGEPALASGSGRTADRPVDGVPGAPRTSNQDLPDEVLVYMPAIFGGQRCDYRVVYDGYRYPASGWPDLNLGSYAVRYSVGGPAAYWYEIWHRDNSHWVGVSRGDFAWRTFGSLEMEAFSVDDGNSVTGLVFGIAEGWTRFMTFEFSHVSEEWLIREFTNTLGWVTRASGQYAVGSSIFRLAIKRDVGGQIRFQIDGDTLATFDPTWGSIEGMVGMCSRSRQAAVASGFDSYRFEGCAVSPLPPDDSRRTGAQVTEPGAKVGSWPRVFSVGW